MQTSFRRVERKPEGLKVDSPKTVLTWVLLGKSLGNPGGGYISQFINFWCRTQGTAKCRLLEQPALSLSLYWRKASLAARSTDFPNLFWLWITTSSFSGRQENKTLTQVSVLKSASNSPDLECLYVFKTFHFWKYHCQQKLQNLEYTTEIIF